MAALHQFTPFPVLFVIAVGVILLAILFSRRRDQSPSESPRACTSCGTIHPGHAKYCRRCGRQLP